MKNITIILMICMYCIGSLQVQAQGEDNNKEQIERLKSEKETIEAEEKKLLMEEVEAINERLEKGEISSSEADKLKKEAAKRRALNIENRIAIIDNKIALLERNPEYDNTDNRSIVRIGRGKNNNNERFIYIGKARKDKPRKYDRRTYSNLTLAFGLNNAIIDDVSLDDTPYELGGSRFFEIGWTWDTRVFKNTNFLRLKYGYSFQINGLRQKEDVIFVEDGNVTRLEPFPVSLRKSKLSNSNLVFPVHFEFGPSKKIEGDNYFRYSRYKKFKFGIGGYAGFNIGTRQKLKFRDESGNRQKDKIRGDFNTTDFVYGVSSYIGVGNTALYFKYDLSPIFRNQAVDQNNISLGVRFDFD